MMVRFRALKAEVNSLRQTDSDHRMKMADLNREIARWVTRMYLNLFNETINLNT